MDKRKRRLLCMLEGSGRKSRWISGAPPLSFRAKKAGTLENYRIYGNTVGGESVGDLVESGEHAGEYEVSVTVEGKNLLPTIAVSYSSSGVLIRSGSDGTVIVSGTATAKIFAKLRDNISYPFDTILSGCPQGGSAEGYCLRAMTPPPPSIVGTDFGNGTLIPANTEVRIEIRIENGYECNNLKFNPMIRKADIEDDTYEPYHAPVTTPIYLPEQIRKVGDEAEYIDYAEQKMHRIGADDINVTLPALPTFPETNVLSVGTAVQPSEIEAKGKIKAL